MRVHHEGGKEPGTMVIGSASELRLLAANLVSALETAPEVSSEKFPPHLHTVDLGDDSPKAGEFLSFNLEIENAAKPKRNATGLTVLWIAVFILAMLGVVQIVSWLR